MRAEHGAATDLDGGDKAGGAVPSVDASSDKARLNWPAILALAAPLVERETALVGVAPSLRRVHYLLVSSPAATSLGYANTLNCYKTLSRKTTQARDLDTFPHLIDQTRSVEIAPGWTSAQSMLRALAASFTLNRDQHLDVQVVLIAEKAGVVPLLTSRYRWLPVTASRGYVSVSHARRIAELVTADREAVGIYVGDYDPTGLDIDRALGERLPFPLRRVALTAEQIAEHRLPPAPAKATDSRTRRMQAEHGTAMQVEIDALPSAALFSTIDAALARYAGVIVRADGLPDWPDVDQAEAEQRQWLQDLAAGAR